MKPGKIVVKFYLWSWRTPRIFREAAGASDPTLGKPGSNFLKSASHKRIRKFSFATDPFISMITSYLGSLEQEAILFLGVKICALKQDRRN